MHAIDEMRQLETTLQDREKRIEELWGKIHDMRGDAYRLDEQLGNVVVEPGTDEHALRTALRRRCRNLSMLAHKMAEAGQPPR